MAGLSLGYAWGSSTRRRIAVAVVAALVAGCSAAPPVTGGGVPAASVPLVAIKGHVVIPPGYLASRFRLVVAGRPYPVSRDGDSSFMVPARSAAVAAAVPEGHSFGWLAVVQEHQTSTVLDAQSTARALVFLSPLLSTSVAGRAAIVMRVIDANRSVRSLASTLTAKFGEAHLLGDPRFVASYRAALRSVIRSLSKVTGQRHPGAGQASVTDAVLADQGGCSAPVVIVPTYDQTQMNVSQGQPCSMMLTTDGPASTALGQQIATTDWLWTAAQLLPASASWQNDGLSRPAASPDAVQADAMDTCAVYSGEETASVPILLLPPASVYAWLADWVGEAIDTATERVFGKLASADNGAAATYTMANADELTIYRAYSGGGEIAGNSNSCLTAAADGIPKGTSGNGSDLSTEALAINLMTIALDAIGPVISLTDPEFDDSHPCVTDQLETVLDSISSNLGPVSGGGTDALTAIVTTEVNAQSALLQDLLSCAASDIVTEGAINFLVQTVVNLDKDLLEKASAVVQLLPALGAAGISLINLAEYSYPVESGFVTDGNPFAKTSATPSPSPTPSPTSSPTSSPSASCDTSALWNALHAFHPNAYPLTPAGRAPPGLGLSAHCAGGWAELQGNFGTGSSTFGRVLLKQTATGWQFVMGDQDIGAGGPGLNLCAQWPLAAVQALGAYLCVPPTGPFAQFVGLWWLNNYSVRIIVSVNGAGEVYTPSNCCSAAAAFQLTSVNARTGEASGTVSFSDVPGLPTGPITLAVLDEGYALRFVPARGTSVIGCNVYAMSHPSSFPGCT